MNSTRRAWLPAVNQTVRLAYGSMGPPTMRHLCSTRTATTSRLFVIRSRKRRLENDANCSFRRRISLIVERVAFAHNPLQSTRNRRNEQ
jgi:hypothetical protein